MLHVVTLTEARMAAQPERAAAWREYARATSAWVPLPPRQYKAE
jgi:hypothetical protein